MMGKKEWWIRVSVVWLGLVAALELHGTVAQPGDQIVAALFRGVVLTIVAVAAVGVR